MAHPTHPTHSLQESQQLWDEAIDKIIEQIAGLDHVTTVDLAIQTLIATGGQYADAATHALYLQKVPASQFKRDEVTKYLAEHDDDDSLISTYFKLVHFGGVTIDQSLRLYFTDLNLVALNNTNLGNNVLTSLAEAYLDANKQYLNNNNVYSFKGDIDDCVRVYNAMVRLQLSLYSKKLSGGSRMTETQFIDILNDRKACPIENFEETEMRRIFNSIAGLSLYKKSGNAAQLTPASAQEQGKYEGIDKGDPSSHSRYGHFQQGSDIIDDPNGKYRTVSQGGAGGEPAPGGGTCCVVL